MYLEISFLSFLNYLLFFEFFTSTHIVFSKIAPVPLASNNVINPNVYMLLVFYSGLYLHRSLTSYDFFASSTNTNININANT